MSNPSIPMSIDGIGFAPIKKPHYQPKNTKYDQIRNSYGLLDYKTQTQIPRHQDVQLEKAVSSSKNKTVVIGQPNTVKQEKLVESHTQAKAKTSKTKTVKRHNILTLSSPSRKFLVISLILLMVGVLAIETTSKVYSRSIITNANKSLNGLSSSAPAVSGLNITVPASQLSAKLQQISSQVADLTVGTNQIAISPSTITSWINISSNPDKTEYYLSIIPSKVISSLDDLANGYAVSPVDAVQVTHNNQSQLILGGKNGTNLPDIDSINSQVMAVVKNILNGNNNLQFSTPLQTESYSTLTPANFSKLIEVNLTTKQMYVYQNGQIVQNYAVSAGKPSTPTPVGEFHIWSQLTSQTMVGPGYVQPNVPWVSYFDHSGDAIHGVYWRPASVFGNVNTSHGCVGLPVDEAEWVFNWATIGTTVITYNA